MRPTFTRDFTNVFKKPENWNEETDGLCGDLYVRISPYGSGGLIEFASTFKPTPEELVQLNNGGVVELSIIASGQPPVALSVVPPVREVEVADRKIGTYDEHGPATP